MVHENCGSDHEGRRSSCLPFQLLSFDSPRPLIRGFSEEADESKIEEHLLFGREV